jgi:hypothetical protein
MRIRTVVVPTAVVLIRAVLIRAVLIRAVPTTGRGCGGVSVGCAGAGGTTPWSTS